VAKGYRLASSLPLRMGRRAQKGTASIPERPSVLLLPRVPHDTLTGQGSIPPPPARQRPLRQAVPSRPPWGTPHGTRTPAICRDPAPPVSSWIERPGTFHRRPRWSVGATVVLSPLGWQYNCHPNA
jgi:hypothetical protein